MIYAVSPSQVPAAKGHQVPDTGLPPHWTSDRAERPLLVIAMTPEQRKAQADEWRWWRRQSPDGARRAWLADRSWIRNVLRKPEHTAVVLKFLKKSAGSATASQT